ncbi:PEP-CTERM sorting domain-containing protein [Massilia sp. MB5]|uniref:PEP-CTERM sorting domain-containing protein n=1 Tax=Massilia sp. MB5 TaxID=2919578 RepID=UPI001F0CE44A|nr:PEP-CTERM sorting domain-containing protein [Massilia sp. MB5]UMR29587.1 PEP-CTERM sorting domain-containing protein [Massilia sp. MB5]
MNKIYLAAALVAGMSICGTASAEATSNATVSGVSYQLIDLDLNDGISPSLIFVDYGMATAPTSLQAGFEGNQVAFQTLGSRDLAPISMNQTHGTGSMQGYVTSSGTLDSLSLGVTAQISGDGSYSYLQTSATGSSGYTNFILSPKTGVIFTANTTLNGRTSQVGDWAVAMSWLGLVTYVDGLYDTTLSEIKTLSSFYDQTSSGVKTERLTDTLLVRYDNLTNAGQGSGLNVSGFANSMGYMPTPVPEPSTYATLLAGLMLTAYAKRRR